MNYLPFDLEIALKHPERVVTRDGRKVDEIHHFKKVESGCQSVYCVVEGIPQSTWEGGQWCGESNIKSERDLFLLPEVKERWVNIYEEIFEPTICNVFFYESKIEATKMISSIHTYIKTIRITNEPE